ncbi:KxYKxGKxW signal peptide domain-containing protein [Lactobacillaceae bacterium Scapto_B20]
MNKSRYKLYKQGKKWVITAVAATSIGIGSYTLTNPNLVHADTVPIFSSEAQSLVNDCEFYKMADSLSMAAKNNTITDEGPSYESFKAALAAYEIIKEIHSVMYNDLSILARSSTGIPYYLTENQLDSLKMRFNDINSSMMDAYRYRDNTIVLNSAADYVSAVSNITRMYGSSPIKQLDSSGSPVGSVSSRFGTAAPSASSAISSVISSYNVYKNGPRYSQSSFSPFASSAPAASDNVPSSTPNNDGFYWKKVENSLSAEVNKKSDVAVNRGETFAPSSSNNFNTTTSAAASYASSATSSAATSSSSTDSSAVSSAASSSADPAYTPSFANNSNNSSAKPKNDVYKNFYLSLKKKAAKEVTSNKNRVAKYKKEYKLTKNKQQKAKKLKQYRDAKNKLNASQKYLKSINAKSLKY